MKAAGWITEDLWRFVVTPHERDESPMHTVSQSIHEQKVYRIPSALSFSRGILRGSDSVLNAPLSDVEDIFRRLKRLLIGSTGPTDVRSLRQHPSPDGRWVAKMLIQTSRTLLL